MTTSRTIPDRPRPGLPTTALTSIAQQDGSDKLAAAVQTKIKLTKDVCTNGTWNVRTLNTTGKIEELPIAVEHYSWHILGLAVWQK